MVYSVSKSTKEETMALTSADILAVFTELGIGSDLQADQPLLEQGIDSIDLPRAAVAMEKKFGVDLSNAKCENLKTIDLMTTYINSMK
jgi:acyl carrier protein